MEAIRESKGAAPRILVVDDDPAIVSLVRAVLEPEGFEILEAYDGSEAVSMVRESLFDLIILDVMMPVMGGFEACRLIRRDHEVPIVFLSAKGEESDQVIGLTLGADDYVAKPFKPRELVARVKARLRRSARMWPAEDSLYARGIELDPHAHTAKLHEIDLDLTPKEFDMLSVILRNAGRPVSARELFEEVWREPFQSSDANTVMVHIRRIRQKLARIDSSQAYIETVFGVGYRLLADTGGKADERKG